MAKRKRRTFTPEFTTVGVIEDRRGESSQAEVCRQHNLSNEQPSKWERQFLENATPLFDPVDKQSDAAAERIAQLEQLVGRLPWHLRWKKALGKHPRKNIYLS